MCIFLFLKRIKSSHVVFEGNELARKLGKENANPGDKKDNAPNVCLIEGLKNNILSVSHMVDGGKKQVFNSKDFFISKEGSKRVTAKGVTTLENVYVLKGSVSRKKRLKKYLPH